MKKHHLIFLLSSFHAFLFPLFSIAAPPLSPLTPATYSLELNHVNLSDALQLAAKFTHTNIIISPTVTGTTTVHLQHLPAEQLFSTLLTMNGLAKWEKNNVWLIAPLTELTQYQEAENKWQATINETAPTQEKIWQIKYARAEEMAQLLQDDKSTLLSKRGYLKVDKRTNRIYAQDIPLHLQHIDYLIRALDVPTKQILIEARLASVDHDSELTLGIQFKQQNILSPANNEDSSYHLAIAKLANGSLIDMKLSALEKMGFAELISSPSLFTTDQQPATIEAGEEIPYQEVSKSGGTAVTFKKAVLALKVTPHVLPKNQVMLELQINQDRPNNRVVLGVPAISTRQITTHILVKNGQTIVLGGIYEVNKENGEQGLPGLRRIPIVGWLFKQGESRSNKRELLIFVTPKIVTG